MYIYKPSFKYNYFSPKFSATHLPEKETDEFYSLIVPTKLAKEEKLSESFVFKRKIAWLLLGTVSSGLAIGMIKELKELKLAVLKSFEPPQSKEISILKKMGSIIHNMVPYASLYFSFSSSMGIENLKEAIERII